MRPKPDFRKPVRFAPMTRSRAPLEAAAGKLIAAIQKEWDLELGEPWAATSIDVMNAAHSLLQAASKFGSVETVVGSGSIVTFLGEQWAQAHPRVSPFIEALERARRATDGKATGPDH